MNTQICAGCRNQVKGVNFLQCCRCSYKYHLTCLNFNKQDFNGFSKDFKETWVCPTCRCKEPKPGDNSNTPIRSTANPPQKIVTSAALVAAPPPIAPNDEFVTQRVRPLSSCKCSCISAESIRDIIREELDRKFNTQLNEFKLKLSSLEESLAFHFAQNDQLRSANESHKASITELQKDNELLRTENKDFNRRLQLLEQLSRSNNIEIQCIPENKSENIYNTVQQLGKIIKCPVAESDFQYCSRIAKLNNESPRPRSVLVKFNSRRLRDEFLASVVKFNRNNPTDKLNTSHLGIGGQKKSPVYVSEHLTPELKSLHAAARRVARQLNYKFVWVRDGKVYVRKSDSSGYIHVRSEDTLKSLS